MAAALAEASIRPSQGLVGLGPADLSVLWACWRGDCSPVADSMRCSLQSSALLS